MVESVEHHGKVGKSAHMPNLTLSNYGPRLSLDEVPRTTLCLGRPTFERIHAEAYPRRTPAVLDIAEQLHDGPMGQLRQDGSGGPGAGAEAQTCRRINRRLSTCRRP